MHIHKGNIDEFWHRNVRVWLDGIEMDAACITESNEEDGYLVMMILAKDGAPMADPRRDIIRQIRLEGRVDITLDGKDLPDGALSEITFLFIKVRAV